MPVEASHAKRVTSRGGSKPAVGGVQVSTAVQDRNADPNSADGYPEPEPAGVCGVMLSRERRYLSSSMASGSDGRQCDWPMTPDTCLNE